MGLFSLAIGDRVRLTDGTSAEVMSTRSRAAGFGCAICRRTCEATVVSTQRGLTAIAVAVHVRRERPEETTARNQHPDCTIPEARSCGQRAAVR